MLSQLQKKGQESQIGLQKKVAQSTFLPIIAGAQFAICASLHFWGPELRARPDLVSNARLRKIFSRLQHSDVILKPTEKISDVEAELFTLINCHV